MEDRGSRSLHSTLCGMALLGAIVAAAPASFGQEDDRAAGGSAPISETALTQIEALESQKLERTPAQTKMDSQFIYLMGSKALAPLAPSLRPEVRILEGSRVLVDITADVSSDLLRRVEALGGEVVNSFAEYRSIRAVLPLSSLETVAGYADVSFVARAAEATTNTGSVTGEGDTTHRAADARSVFGVTGAGVNVGVMSDSVDFLAGSQGSGDLGPVTVLAGQSGVPGTGEGTAMLEIVADLAPGANLFFATGFAGQASMAANILALQAAGCDVIVDDITYFSESPFQDGVISQAVNTVSAAGVLYFSSARNSGNKDDGTSGTWEGDFADGGAVGTPIPGSGRLHDFGGGTTFDTVTAVNKPRADLFWADPLGASSNDYDLFVLNAAGTAVVRSSTNSQTGSQDPYESVNTLNAGERIVIVKANGAAGRFLHLDTGRSRLSISTAGNVRGHNAAGATNAFSVAATDVSNSFPSPFSGGAINPVETFSSDGPRRMFFDPSGSPFTPGNFSSTGGIVLQKPDITAADGAATSAAVIGFNPFFGTSAAAPHSAAIAALLLSFSPTPTVAQVRGALTTSALDIEAAGFDRDSGAGIVTAFGAMKVIDPCTVTCPGSLVLGNDPDQCGAVANYSSPSLVGGCGTVSCSTPSGSLFPVGTTPVTCTTESEDSCSFSVTVNDVQPPAISCPADVTQSTDPGLCSAVVAYPSPTVIDNCPGASAPTCVPASGSAFGKGTTAVGCTVDDAAGNDSSCGFQVTVDDTEPPEVTCSVSTPLLWPPNHNLVNVGLTASATDNCPGPLPIATHVFGDEDDEVPTGDGQFSPDARDVDLGTLRLRSERSGGGDGRVYLGIESTMDGSGNVGSACCTVVVPSAQSPGSIASIMAQATAAESACSATGAAPPGYFVVGDGPVIGKRQ